MTDGRRIVSGSGPDLHVWDAMMGAKIVTLPGHAKRPKSIISVASSSDGRRIAAGTNDGTIRVWDTEKGLDSLVLRAHNAKRFHNVAFFPDGVRIISSSTPDSCVRQVNAFPKWWTFCYRILE
ncbi:hypothetical protein PILCRDRAFT_816944 [Piloderma croceum F 1598]|uniref:Uncharacterized protein n=1 Tax=Piloderma croceum (strain F 1598) TaxID=765440 RepID=A0A0C3G525_PILCF|nr:hypothetical protein PILCRDRAFT_816944 [Piloderma croceum F 1598]